MKVGNTNTLYDVMGCGPGMYMKDSEGRVHDLGPDEWPFVMTRSRKMIEEDLEPGRHMFFRVIEEPNGNRTFESIMYGLAGTGWTPESM